MNAPPASVAEATAVGAPGARPLPDHGALLLAALADPASTARLSEDRWDLLLRTARQAKLLALLAHRLAGAGALDTLPVERVRQHLTGSGCLAQHRRHGALAILWGVDRAFHDFGHPVVLLKGAAYLFQELPMAEGRIFDDVDILVPREAIPEAERRLTAMGWETEKPDLYDQNYYRVWSHELPPMRHGAHRMQLDVHHTILPVIGRARPDATRLLARAIALDGFRFRVLCPVDQVIHAAAHLFQDSDCVGKIRDLVDLDAMIRGFASTPGFWDELANEPRRHGLGRCLWYTLHYCRGLLGTPVPDAVFTALAPEAPPPPLRRWMDAAIPSVIFPRHPDDRHPTRRPLAERLLEARAVFLRMPLHLLVYHALMKQLRRRKSKTATAAA
jgi:hypothetical protein